MSNPMNENFCCNVLPFILAVLVGIGVLFIPKIPTICALIIGIITYKGVRFKIKKRYPD